MTGTRTATRPIPTVVIGMDPHKRSARIEVLDQTEEILGEGRFATDTTGYRSMLLAGRRFPSRVWAVEGANGIGEHLAQRLLADGEDVVDVPAKLSARARVFSTGQGRKTGGAKKFLSAAQAKTLVATVRPRDVVGKSPASGRDPHRRRIVVALSTSSSPRTS